MTQEVSKHDQAAKYLYEIYRNPQGENWGWWRPWEQLNRKDRDYWRARAQIFLKRKEEHERNYNEYSNNNQHQPASQ